MRQISVIGLCRVLNQAHGTTTITPDRVDEFSDEYLTIAAEYLSAIMPKPKKGKR